MSGLITEPARLDTSKRIPCDSCGVIPLRAHYTIIVVSSARLAGVYRSEFCGAHCQEEWWTSGGSSREHLGFSAPGLWDIHTRESADAARAAHAIGHWLQTCVRSDDHPYKDYNPKLVEWDRAIQMGVFDIAPGSGEFRIGPNAPVDRRLVERWLHTTAAAMNEWFSTPINKAAHRLLRKSFKERTFG